MKMDNFTRTTMAVAMVGTIICAGINAARKSAGEYPQKLTKDTQQFEIDAKAAEVQEEEWPEFLFGSTYDGLQLEKEKEYVAAVTSSDRYIAENYYLGDHYADPRLVVVRSEATGDVVQIFTTASYEKRSQMSAAMDEVPD